MFMLLKDDVILNLDKVHAIELYEKDCTEGGYKRPYAIIFSGDKEMHTLDFETKDERKKQWETILQALVTKGVM